MVVQGQKTTVQEGDSQKEAYSATFTNGALKQLQDLADYYKAADLGQVIALGISVLEKAKESGVAKEGLDSGKQEAATE